MTKLPSRTSADSGESRRAPDDEQDSSVVLVSRIVPKMNLTAFIESMRLIKEHARLAVAGPIEDAGYCERCLELIKCLPDPDEFSMWDRFQRTKSLASSVASIRSSSRLWVRISAMRCLRRSPQALRSPQETTHRGVRSRREVAALVERSHQSRGNRRAH